MMTHSMRITNETPPIDIKSGKCRPNMESTQALQNQNVTCVMKITRLQMRNCHNRTKRTYIRSDCIKNESMRTLILMMRELISLSNSTIFTQIKVGGLFSHIKQVLDITGRKVTIDQGSESRLVVT